MTNWSRRTTWGLVVAAGAGVAWLFTRGEELRPLTPTAPAPAAIATAPGAAAPAEIQRTEAAPTAGTPTGPFVAGPSFVLGGPTARFTGRCLAAESGRPLAGCGVKLDGNGPAVATSGADGTFDVMAKLDQTGRVWMRIEASGRVPRIGDFENLRNGSVEKLGDITLPRGFVVTGRVVDPDGRGVTGNNVVVFGVDTMLRAGQFGQGSATARCADDGTFTLDMAMPPGQWRAGLFGPRQPRQRGDGAFRIDPATGVEPLVLVVEPANEISGLVVDEQGQPLHDVGLKTEHGDATAESNPNGRFRLASRQAVSGPTRVLLVDPGNWSPSFVPPTVDWGQNDVRLVLPRGSTVTIEAVDDQGEPVTEFGVLFLPTERPGLSASRDYGHHPEGRMTLSTARHGRHVLRVLPKALELLASEPQFVEVAGGWLPTHRVVLERMRAVGVLVVGGDGAPVQGAAVSLVRIGKNPAYARNGEQDPRQRLAWYAEQRSAELVAAAPTDRDGLATLFAPAATNGFLLRARADGYEPAYVQDPPLSPTMPLRIVLARGGSLAGRVELHGQSRDLFRLEVRRADGNTMDLDWRTKELGPDGAFAIPLLPVGDYAVTVLRQIHVQLPGSMAGKFVPFGAAAVRTRVVAGETAKVDLDAPTISLGSLRGRITGVDRGWPDPVALLSLLGTENAQRGTFPIGADGSFLADALPPGRYQLAVAARQHFALSSLPALLAPEFDIVPGGAHTQDFVLTRRKLTLRLRTATGEPTQDDVDIRCSSLLRSLGKRPEVVLDPAPELPVQVRYQDAGEWSEPVSMPQDRPEHVIDVVVPGQSR